MAASASVPVTESVVEEDMGMESSVSALENVAMVTSEDAKGSSSTEQVASSLEDVKEIQIGKPDDSIAMDVDIIEPVGENPSAAKKKRVVEIAGDRTDQWKEQVSSSPQKQKSSLKIKKEGILKQLLLITLNSKNNDSSLVNIELDDASSSEDDGISIRCIGEILAYRLAIPAKSPELKSQRYTSTVSYLAGCYKRASESLVQMTSSSSKDTPILIEFAREIETQIISYTVSSLAYPDLFPSMADGSCQLSKMFQTDTLSLTAGGASNSFYGKVCFELDEQGVLSDVIKNVAKDLMEVLKKCNTALDNGAAIIGALADLASNKKAAVAITQLDNFVLPPENSPQASERVEGGIPEMAGLNPQQRQMFRMMQMMGGRNSGYLRRSGPALEKETLLGLCMRLGMPPQDPSITVQFSNPGRRTRADVEGTRSNLRRQLQIHRDATLRLVKALLTSGPQCRQRIMAWFSECFLLNHSATALSPNPSIVSTKQTLLNVSYTMLKLAEPFVNNDKKLSFIDPNFIRSSDAHAGVFTTDGDGAVTRLSSSENQSQNEPYSPKNSFIPICFFYTARSLHLGLLPNVQRFENLVRRLQHEGYTLSQRGENWRDDENYNRLLELQFSHEVTACDNTFLELSLAFYECMAKFLNSLGKCLIKLIEK